MPKPTALLKRLKSLFHRGPPANVQRTHRSRHRRALSGDNHSLLAPEAVTDNNEEGDHQLAQVSRRDRQNKRTSESGSAQRRQRSRQRSGRVLEAEVPDPFADPAGSERTLTTDDGEDGDGDVISLAEAMRVLEPSGSHESSERGRTGGSAGESENRRSVGVGAGDGASDSSDGEAEETKKAKVAELTKKIARLNEMISEFGVKKRNCKAELRRLKADIGELRKECVELNVEIDEIEHEG